MQNLADLVEDESRCGACLRPGSLLFALQYGFGEFDIPVAEHVPDEAVDCAGGIVEPECVEGVSAFSRHLGRFSDDPSVERYFQGIGVESFGTDAIVQLGEPGGIPKLGGEIPVA